MTDTTPTPFVTVTVQMTRENAEAVLAHGEGMVEQSYTPLGIGWMTVMAAIREALEAVAQGAGT